MSSDDATRGPTVKRSRDAAVTPDIALGGRGRLVRIAAAILLATAGMVFSRELRATPFRIAEYAVFLVAYALVGAGVLRSAVRNIVHGRVFDEMFLMSVATLGAIAIGELAEAVAVMLFYSVGEQVQDLAVGRSRRSIAELMDVRPDTARVGGPEGVRVVEPREVAVGETVEVWPGERVPLDGEVIDGASAVDTSALTGESVPRPVTAGDEVFAGFVNGGGTLRVRVSRPFGESSVARILALVEHAAERKAPTERFISRFAAVYTPIVVGIAAGIAFLPPLLFAGAALGDWVYRALVLLVISCPCALVVSIPLGYFGGIGRASRHGILVKGANFMDALKDVSTVVFDKTGTLTRGVFRVSRIVSRNGYSEQEVLSWAALAESRSTHPIAGSIREAWEEWAGTDATGEHLPVAGEVVEAREEQGHGVIAVCGSPADPARATHRVVAGSDRLLHREEIEHTDCEVTGTVVYVAVDGTYIGYLVISDEIRPEAAEAVRELRARGVKRVVMLTGDNDQIARHVAREAGIAEVHAELLPDEKVALVEEMAAALPAGKRLAFAGDGINDAPVLMRSDVGIAMGGLGSDAAIEAADVVIMDDRLDRIPSALAIAHATRRVVVGNIALALAVKALFIGFGSFGLASMWEAVIADVGVSLLAVLNAARLLWRR